MTVDGAWPRAAVSYCWIKCLFQAIDFLNLLSIDVFFVMVFCHGILVGDWDAQDKPWNFHRLPISERRFKKTREPKTPAEGSGLGRAFFSRIQIPKWIKWHSCHDCLDVWCVLEMLAPCILWYT